LIELAFLDVESARQLNLGDRKTLMSSALERFQSTWKRIEDVLLAHAADAAKTLAEPATAEQISELERVLGYSLPESLTASLRIHNGQNDALRLHSFSKEGMFLSTREIAETWSMLTQENGTAATNWWSPRWIPVVQADGSALCINMEFGGPGGEGEVIGFVHDSSYEAGVAPSFEKWLETLAGQLESGDFKVDEYGYLWPNLAD